MNKKIHTINQLKASGDQELMPPPTSDRVIRRPKSKQTNKEKPSRLSYIVIDETDEEKKENEASTVAGQKDDPTSRKLTRSSSNNVNILNVVPLKVDKINCNGVEMIREKVASQPKEVLSNDKYVYDIYYVKNSEMTDLNNMFNWSNYEIKSFTGHFENDDLVDDLNEADEEGTCLFCFAIRL